MSHVMESFWSKTRAALRTVLSATLLKHFGTDAPLLHESNKEELGNVTG